MKFTKGDKVIYIGKGFLGFDMNEPYATFLRYDGDHDSYVRFKNSDHDTLLFTNEIKLAL